MNKLDKKLAEWRGFEWEEDAQWWVDPNRNMYMLELPNFTESLDACFKWLVPKLYERDYFYELLQWNAGQHKAIISKKTAGWTSPVSDAVAGNPALALCSALEKLIDGRLV